MDTPGFTSLYIEGMEKEELKEFYPEFLPYEPYCRFGGCVHLSEPVCGVKEALAEGEISRRTAYRYKAYYDELQKNKGNMHE